MGHTMAHRRRTVLPNLQKLRRFDGLSSGQGEAALSMLGTGPHVLQKAVAAGFCRGRAVAALGHRSAGPGVGPARLARLAARLRRRAWPGRVGCGADLAWDTGTGVARCAE